MKSSRFLIGILVFLSLTSEDCSNKAVSASGVSKATAKVQTNLEGHTQEQLNIIRKIDEDNKIGKIRYLYIISSYTGNVLESYVIRGKTTSGNKRLNPKTTSTSTGIGTFEISPNVYTDEMLSDDGTYGESLNYFFFFDSKGIYQQVYPSGGTYTRVSDVPLRINKNNLTFTIE